ncbi:MAG: S8 family serine peptidase [Proteobacteria bacterium]|nr:S8 family serine peptidase [Pseudomonadota bacterium]
MFGRKPFISKARAGALASASAIALMAASAQAQDAGGQSQTASGPVTPLYGKISPFYGDIDPSYGKISPFYGKLSPFYGKISPFYGDVTAFWGSFNPFVPTTDPTQTSFYGKNYDPFWGQGYYNPYTSGGSPFIDYSKVGGFWKGMSTSWSGVQSAWTAARASGDYSQVANLLQSNILNPSAAFWGKAVSKGRPMFDPSSSLQSVKYGAAVKGDANAAAGTAYSNFGANFSAAVLSNAGVRFNADGTIDPNSLAAMSDTDANMMFLNYYDGLMAYAATGHVDWWMGATGWSPALQTTVGGNGGQIAPITVGMLDFTVSPAGTTAKGSLMQYGSNVFDNGHGAAVGSLIMGSVDGSGVWGVMSQKNTRVIAYNPYDETGTTNWDDVGKGIDALATSIFPVKGKGPLAPTGVLNASLGVPGWTLNPGWNDALASGKAYGHNLVIAAGNDGVTQTANVPWDFSKNPVIIVVGSVGLDGTISNFSNRPGEACLTDPTSGVCLEANKLKYRFITAPGELVLVSDGHGGTTRQTGTSLAAPLVAGAIGLLQERWPWLSYYPEETAQIILQTATPMGTNPGADPVYGVGELNIAASQQPLNFDNVVYYRVANGLPSLLPVSATTVANQIRSGTQSTWNMQGLYYAGLEPVGRTFRDFQIPLGSSLVGNLTLTAGGLQYFQSNVTMAMRKWAGTHFADTDVNDAAGFSRSLTTMGQLGDMDLRMSLAPHDAAYGLVTSVPFDSRISLSDKRQTLSFGYGAGAQVINGQAGFSSSHDFTATGGADPVLGLASGGAYVDWKFKLDDRWGVSLSSTDRQVRRDIAVYGSTVLDTSAETYAANAQRIGVDFTPTPGLTLRTGLTRLREDSGLLGMQSIQSGALDHGSVTQAVNFGVDLKLPAKTALSASTTWGRTTVADGQAFSTGRGGLISTGAEIALTRDALFRGGDRLRLSVSQPLHVVSGQVGFSTYGVVDRQTGELGVINESASAATSKQPLVGELTYDAPVMKGAGEAGVFFRATDGVNDGYGGMGRTVLGGVKLTFKY